MQYTSPPPVSPPSSSTSVSDASPAPPRHRWKVLTAGVIANAAFSMAFSGIPMTAVLLRTSYGLDNVTLGVVLGLLGLGIAMSELPWGLLTDRWGDRPVLLVGLGGTTLALLGMAFWAGPAPAQLSTHLPAIYRLGLGLLLVGLLGGSVNSASGRAVMSWFSEGERGFAMSVRQTAIPMGGALGALLLPLLATRWGFAASFAGLALACAFGTALAWRWIQEPLRVEAVPSNATPISAPGIDPLRNARIWRFVAGIGILCAPQLAVLSFGTIFLHDVAQVSIPLISAVMAAVQIGAMVMRVWSGRWTDQRRNRPAYLHACIALSAALFVLLGLAALICKPSMTMSWGAQLLLITLVIACGICVSAWHGVAYAELASRCGPQRTGTALGMANTFVFVTMFLTPVALPHLQALSGWPLVWWSATACALLAWPLLVPEQLASLLRLSKQREPAAVAVTNAARAP